LVKGWKNPEKSFVKVFTVLPDVITESKHIVHVGPNVRKHVHAVLGRQHEEDVPVATVHEESAHAVVSHEGFVVHAIVHQQKYGRGFILAQTLDEPVLSLEELFNSILSVFAINEQIRNKLFIVSVTILSS
jgi:hypothetical protein